MIGTLWKNISELLMRLKSRFISLEELGNPLASSSTSTVRTDHRDRKMRARVAKAFEQQQKLLKIRALKPHDPNCKDPLMCKQPVCFNRVPDKIVSDAYKVTKKVSTNESMGIYARPKRRMRKTTCRKK